MWELKKSRVRTRARLEMARCWVSFVTLVLYAEDQAHAR